MQKEKLKLLDKLFAAGYTTEADIQKIGLADLLSLGKTNHSQIELLVSLQHHVKSNKLLQWLAEDTASKKQNSAPKET